MPMYSECSLRVRRRMCVGLDVFCARRECSRRGEAWRGEHRRRDVGKVMRKGDGNCPPSEMDWDAPEV